MRWAGERGHGAPGDPLPPLWPCPGLSPVKKARADPGGPGAEGPPAFELAQEGELAVLLAEQLVEALAQVLVEGGTAAGRQGHVLLDLKGGELPTGASQGLQGTRGMAPVAAGQARLLCESQQRHEGGRQAKGEPSPLGKCEVSTGREPGLSLSDGPRCGGTAATVSTCSASLPQACLRSATQWAPLAT